MVKNVLTFSNSSHGNSGFNLTSNNIFCSEKHNYSTWLHSRNYKQVAGRGRPIFGAKLDAWRHKMCQVFHFLQSDMLF